MKTFSFQMFHKKAIKMHSPRMIKSFLGRCGIKLSFETKYRWAMLDSMTGEIIGFMRVVR